MITNWFTNGSKNNANNKGKAHNSVAKYQIGDRVQNGRYGSGRVQAFRPDGSVIVRFDGRKNSQVIFPTLLEKGN